MADPGKLSSSKITTYKGCSLAYYLQYVEHERIPVNVRLAFGQAIHYMLKLFYKRNFKSPESFAKYWKYYWFSTVSGEFLKGKQKADFSVEEFELKNGFVLKIGNHINLGPEPVGVFFGYKKLGENILEAFYRKHKDRARPIAVEKPFGIKKGEEITINGHRIRGVFDRIDRILRDSKECYYITDYKTDKNSPEQDSFTLHRNPQFTIYSYAFRELFGVKEEALLYYHLRKMRRLETHRSEKDYDYLKGLLDEVVEGIAKDKFVPFYGFHCNFCNYKPTCEKYSVTYHGGPRIDLEGKIKSARTFDEWDIKLPEEAGWLETQAEER